MKIKNALQEQEPFYITEKNPARFTKKYIEKYKTLYYSRKVKEIEKLVYFPLRGKDVLDLGCCGGYFSVRFAKLGAKVVGVDMSKNALNAAKYYAEKEKVNVNFIYGDATKIKAKNKFDFILAKDIIEHIPDDVAFLKNLNKYLKPGGKVIITTQNWFCFNYFFEGLIRKLLGQKKWLGWDSTHLRWYSSGRLGRKLKKAGFKVKGYSGSYYLPYEILKAFGIEPRCRLFTLIDDLFGGIWPFNRLGWSISVLAEKAQKE